LVLLFHFGTVAGRRAGVKNVVPRMGDAVEKDVAYKKTRMEAYAFQYNFCRIVSAYIQLGIWVKLMTHFLLDPPRIKKDDRKQRSSYCHECLERFAADDVRCSYGTRYFHKECYKRWQQKKLFQRA
jgi:hypothetical protein